MRLFFFLMTVYCLISNAADTRIPVTVKLHDNGQQIFQTGFLVSEETGSFAIEFTDQSNPVREKITYEQFQILNEVGTANFDRSLNLHYRAPGSYSYQLNVPSKREIIFIKLKSAQGSIPTMGILTIGSSQSQLELNDGGQKVILSPNSHEVKALRENGPISIERNVKLHYRAPGTFQYTILPKPETKTLSVTLVEGATKRQVPATLTTGYDFSGKGKLEFNDQGKMRETTLEGLQLKSALSKLELTLERSLSLHYRSPGTYSYAVIPCQSALALIAD